MDKHQRKALRKNWKQAERASLLAGMPIAPAQLHQLLDYVEANLDSCDHTTKLTATFLDGENIDSNNVLSWLAEHGGHCDCEVVANLADLDESLNTPATIAPIIIPPKPDRMSRSLATVTGWNLSRLPPPWRVANLHRPAEPILLQPGKKPGCTLHIIESPFPAGDQTSEEFWSGLWYARTELSPKGPLRVRHGVLELPESFQSTMVRSPSWIPVYCWIVPDSGGWYAEMRTEGNRLAGDLPLVSLLVTRLARGEA